MTGKSESLSIYTILNCGLGVIFSVGGVIIFFIWFCEARKQHRKRVQERRLKKLRKNLQKEMELSKNKKGLVKELQSLQGPGDETTTSESAAKRNETQCVSVPKEKPKGKPNRTSKKSSLLDSVTQETNESGKDHTSTSRKPSLTTVKEDSKVNKIRDMSTVKITDVKTNKKPSQTSTEGEDSINSQSKSLRIKLLKSRQNSVSIETQSQIQNVDDSSKEIESLIAKFENKS